MAVLAAFVPATNDGCESNNTTPTSASGVSKATVKVPVGANGLTTEQTNVAERLKRDNEPGSIKHLYVISPYTGDVLIYSTVKGKVTSGGKRLTPTGVSEVMGSAWCHGFETNISGTTVCTQEVLQDDGTYGSSGDYLYWTDTKGTYHQQYATGVIIHVSDQPLPVKHVVMNMELSKEDQEDDRPTSGSPVLSPRKKP